jgi:glycerophosphoryl diester phosphodiesterase
VRKTSLILISLLVSACGFLDAGDPVIEAHRSGAGYWPQNSRLAVTSALVQGFPSLEVDLVLTADHVAVLSHDPWLHKTCTHSDGSPLDRRIHIRDLPLGDLQADYVCGGLPDSEFPEAEVLAEPVLSFPDFLELVSEFPDVRLHLDVKVEPGDTPRADAFADAMLPLLRDPQLENPWLLSANLPGVIREFESRGGVETVLIWPRFPPGSSDVAIALENEAATALGVRDLVALVRDAGADGIAIPYQLIERRQVEALRDEGVRVQVWTPNSPALLKHYCRWPLDALITDYPGRAPCLSEL